MKLQRKGKRKACRHCKHTIFSFEPRYKATEGHYCVNDGRIKRLHDGAMKFIKGIING